MNSLEVPYLKVIEVTIGDVVHLAPAGSEQTFCGLWAVFADQSAPTSICQDCAQANPKWRRQVKSELHNKEPRESRLEPEKDRQPEGDRGPEWPDE